MKWPNGAMNCSFTLWISFYETRKAEQDRVGAQLFLEQTKNDLVTKVHKNYYAYLALKNSINICSRMWK